jgi:PKD repeat protein
MLRILLMSMFLSAYSLYSQRGNMVIPDLTVTEYKVLKPRLKEMSEEPVLGLPRDIECNWGVTLQNYESINHPTSVPKSEFWPMKDRANEKRLNIDKSLLSPNPSEGRNALDIVQINSSFEGNIRNNSVPMDNTIAVSRNGHIVSAINVNVMFTDPSGETRYSATLSDFFSLLNLGTSMYDPRVIYDVEENRFIFMCLHGSSPSTTQLCIAYSQTEDPNGYWNYYKIKGNPKGDPNWFDYPNIAISKEDLYIAGLMRNNDGDWQYSVLYQINKSKGYEGGRLDWVYYDEIYNADNEPAFNLVPAPGGWQQLSSPGIYMVSNDELGGNRYNLYFTTDSTNGDPEIISLQTSGIATELAPDGRQPGTSKSLNTFDSRIWSAMYQDGVIHMGGHVNTPTGDVGLLYGRYDVTNNEVHADILHEPDRDMAFPSFSSVGKSENDSEILVNYLVSGPDIFPGQEQRVFAGKAADFDWGDPIPLRPGSDYVDVLTGDRERWGDYTTSSRRFFMDRVETWVFGCHGASRRWRNWIGQYVRKDETELRPTLEFVADVTTLHPNLITRFSDLTTHDPIAWEWSFPGGQPAMSNDEEPVVQYSELGSYDVQLIVSTALGVDTIIKKDYIHVVERILPPKADFTLDMKEIYVDDTVTYTDISTGLITTRGWVFFSGTPPLSEEEAPRVTYKNSGTFFTSLEVRNIAGTDSKIDWQAIKVIRRVQPNAEFSASSEIAAGGDTIQFFDLSTGGPREYIWNFEGGEPSSSNQKNPSVVYHNEGTYSVGLKVKNEAGEDEIIKDNFIQILSSGAEDLAILDDFKVFPNPVSGERVYAQFSLKNSQKLSIGLYDARGKHLKWLYNDKVKAGRNELTFNTGHLASGLYFIRFQSSENKVYSLSLVVE